MVAIDLTSIEFSIQPRKLFSFSYNKFQAALRHIRICTALLQCKCRYSEAYANWEMLAILAERVPCRRTLKRYDFYPHVLEYSVSHRENTLAHAYMHYLKRGLIHELDVRPTCIHNQFDREAIKQTRSYDAPINLLTSLLHYYLVE